MAAGVIRVASSAVYGRAKVGTIRGAILRIGEKSIRTLALALSMQTVQLGFPRHRLYDPFRACRHSLFVGLAASLLHAQLETTQGNLSWSAEEILAAGVMHDLHFGILARLAPEAFDQCVALAEERKCSFEYAFANLFECHGWELTTMALEAWAMPPVFADCLRKMHGRSLETLDSHCSLAVAHGLSRRFGLGLEAWDVEEQEAPIEIWPLPPEAELIELMKLVENETEAFLQTTLAIKAA